MVLQRDIKIKKMGLGKGGLHPAKTFGFAGSE